MHPSIHPSTHPSIHPSINQSINQSTNQSQNACSLCTAGAAYPFRNKELAVVGGGDTAVEEAIYLTKYGSKAGQSIWPLHVSGCTAKVPMSYDTKRLPSNGVVFAALEAT